MAVSPTGDLSRDTAIFLDVEATDLNQVLDVLARSLADHGDAAHVAEIGRQLRRHADLGFDALDNGVALIHSQLRTSGPDVQALLRLPDTLELDDDQGEPTRFLWVLLSEQPTHPHLAVAAEFTQLAEERSFREAALAARDVRSLDAIYRQALDDDLYFAPGVAPELRPTGRLFGALQEDIQRKRRTWVSDFRDGMNSKALASTIFLYFACLAPSVAFGGLLSVMTDGSIGVVETMLATAITGVLYALFSGQPMSILGSTGPITAFLGVLYGLCAWLDVPYLPSLAWVGLWTSFYLFVLIAFDGVSLIRFFTRFTDETFAGLIALIYLWEAFRDIGKVFTDHKVSYATALLSLVLSLGTYQIASNLSAFRKSPYLRRGARDFLADFGPTIAIVAMTLVAFAMREVELETLAVPETFGTTSGRGWFVDPFSAPRWVWFAASIPAIMGTILVYLDQNITVRLVNSPSLPLKKGAGYHLDQAIVAALVGVFSLLGLPWTVAATVRSLNHVRSLETITETDGVERVEAVMENRVTHLGVHVLIGASLLLLPVLALVPTSVLFGLFLYMGVASMSGNQLFERMRLWVLDPTHYPPNHYLRAVPQRVIHAYTAVQAACLGVLWLVKASPLGIVFPLFIAMLVPVRMVMGRYFEREHLALLDAEEVIESTAGELT
jgi:mannitol/fructose-specific phosphotransferase system IIA component (Ntr-type)